MIGLKMPKERTAKMPAEKAMRMKPEKPVKFKPVHEPQMKVHAEKVKFAVPKSGRNLEGFKAPGEAKPPKATAY